MLRKHLIKAFTLFAVTFALAGANFAQGTTTRVTGVVTDSSGAAITGATVTLQRGGTGFLLTTQTADNGQYIFDLLQVGSYDVTVEKSGFKKFVSGGNPAYINQPATVNVRLEIGDVSAVVTVQNTAEVVQTSSSGNLGTTIERRSFESLPIFGLKGRNPLDLVSFQPGVSADIDNESGGGVHSHGSRDRAFNFTLDGVDINESSFGGSNFTPLRPNPDSLQEVQIVTSNFTAELGRSSGAQVTFITRSGSNIFHGNVFENYMTPRFNANEYGNNLNRRAKGQFVQHIYGGSFGGPLPNLGFGEGTSLGWLRDKAFFFVNLQMLRASQTSLVTRTVLTETARTGLFRYIQGGQNAPTGTTTPSVTSSGAPTFAPCGSPVVTPCLNTYNIATASAVEGGLDTTILALIALTPLPNNFSAGDGLNTAGYSFGAPVSEKQYDFVSKFDFKISDSNLFYIRYAQGSQNSYGSTTQAFPNTPIKGNSLRDPKNIAVNWRFSPTARFTNEFIFGINKYKFSFTNPDPNADTNTPVILNLLTDPLSNSAPLNNSREITTTQFVDNLTFDFSPHTIKTGVNFRFGREIDDRTGVAGTFTTLGVDLSITNNPVPVSYGVAAIPGINTGTDAQNLRRIINNLVGRYGTRTQAFVALRDGSAFAPAGTHWDFTAYNPEYNFYVQDSWKARSNLLIDLGMRWEENLQPHSKGRPILRPTTPVTLGSPASTSLSWTAGELFKTDLNNFAPSVGIAWDPFKSGKTSIRANFRMSYDRMNTFLLASSIYQSTPGNTIAVSSTAPGLIRNGIPALVPPGTPLALQTPPAFSTNTIHVMDPNIKMPETYQWSASFQREIFSGNVLEINYIGSRGVHLFGGYDANQVNILASDPRCPGETFLSAFNAVRGGSTNSCLINYLWSGTNASNTGTTGFIANTTIAPTLSTSQTGGGVATAAAFISQNRNSIMVTNGFASSFFQKYPQFTGALNVLDSNDFSRYNGLEVIFKRRFNNGYSFQLAYTLSQSKDTRSMDPTQTTIGRGTGQAAGSTPFDNNNRTLNYAWSDFDRRHSVQGFYTVELPFGKGRKFGSSIPSVLDYIIGGWQLSGLLNKTSGRPFTVYGGANTLTNAVPGTANCSGCSRNIGKLIQESGTNFWFDSATRSLFKTPDPGSSGNTGRNYFIGPGLFQTDASLSKKFNITERVNFELKVDVKNLTNSISFIAPTNVSTSTTFGRIRDAVYSSVFARKVQLGAKINF